MKSAVITLKELKRGNKRLCLSPKRALGRCFECRYYETCESRTINKDYDTLETQRQTENKRHTETIKAIERKIKAL